MTDGGPHRAERRERPPSIRDVAAAAGVSYQTVSRVLNDHPSIRPETRARIVDAMNGLGYRPSRAARTLATARHRTIGLLVTTRAQYGPFSASLAIESAARQHGYAIASASIADAAEAPDALASLLDHGIDGLAVIAPQAQVQRELAAQIGGVPTVTFEWRGATSVAIDQVGGAKAATRHLLDLGHTRIAHLAGPAEWPEAEERARGFVDELSDAGLLPAAISRGGDWSAESGYTAGRELLTTTEVTAVFSVNDQMALGLLHAAAELGRGVPHDLSVVGFDDVPEAAHYLPPLTTVRQDFGQLGRAVIDRLLREIDSGVRPEPIPDLPTALIVRSSTARPA